MNIGYFRKKIGTDNNDINDIAYFRVIILSLCVIIKPNLNIYNNEEGVIYCS